MAGYELPYFGKIRDEELASGKINSDNDLGCAISINFGKEVPVAEQLADVGNFLKQAPQIIDDARAFISNQFKKGSKTIIKYLEYIEKQLAKQTEVNLFDNESDESIEMQLLNKLYVSFLFIYPNSDNFGQIEFSINQNIYKYLLVFTDKSGKIKGVEIDS